MHKCVYSISSPSRNADFMQGPLLTRRCTCCGNCYVTTMPSGLSTTNWSRLEHSCIFVLSKCNQWILLCNHFVSELPKITFIYYHSHTTIHFWLILTTKCQFHCKKKYIPMVLQHCARLQFQQEMWVNKWVPNKLGTHNMWATYRSHTKEVILSSIELEIHKQTEILIIFASNKCPAKGFCFYICEFYFEKP